MCEMDNCSIFCPICYDSNRKKTNVTSDYVVSYLFPANYCHNALRMPSSILQQCCLGALCFRVCGMVSELNISWIPI